VGVKFLGLRFAIVVNGIEYGAQNAVDKWVNMMVRAVTEKNKGTFSTKQPTVNRLVAFDLFFQVWYRS
jgi:hypothetical protein